MSKVKNEKIKIHAKLVRIYKEYQTILDLLAGIYLSIPTAIVLGSLLYNIYINDDADDATFLCL